MARKGLGIGIRLTKRRASIVKHILPVFLVVVDFAVVFVVVVVVVVVFVAAVSEVSLCILKIKRPPARERVRINRSVRLARILFLR